MLFEKAFDTAREVVNVPGFFDAGDKGAAVPTTVAGVENEGHAREVGRPDPVDELRRLQPRLLLLDPLRVVLRAKLWCEVFDRDLDGVTDRNRAHVRDPAALRDLRRLRVDVLGMDPPGQPDDDGGVERLPLPKAVGRVPTLLVAPELERR